MDDLGGLLHDADPIGLGRRIRNARLSRGLTQGQLADGDVTVGYISRIEAGQRRPDLALLTTLASRLDQPVRELVTGEASDVVERCELSLYTAEFLIESGDAAQAVPIVDELLRDDAITTIPRLSTEARYLRGRALEATGDYAAAIDDLERVAQHEQTGRWLKALTALSRCYRESGDFGNAIEVGERVRDRLLELGLESSEEAIQLEVTVGFAYYARGDVDHAVRLIRQTITRADERGTPVARASAYWNASIYEAARGARAAAIPLAQRALALLGEGEDVRNLARLRAQLGSMLLDTDPPDVAEGQRLLEQAAADLRDSSASAVDVARCDLDIARARFIDGDLEAAEAIAQQSLDTARGTSPKLEAAALTLLGQLAYRDGSRERAGERYRSAVAVLTSIGADRAAAQAWLDLAALLEEVGDSASALQAYRSAAVATGLQVPTRLQRRVDA